MEHLFQQGNSRTENVERQETDVCYEDEEVLKYLTLEVLKY